MKAAVGEGGLEVRERIARDDAPLRGLAHALLDGGPEVARDGAADDVRLEDHARPRGLRLDLEPDVAELSVAAGLTLIAALRGRLPADGLAVRDLRGVHLHLHAELLFQPVDRDLDRGFADRREDRLVRRVVAAHVERGILVGQLVQRGRQLVEVGFARRLDRHRERRRREVDRVVQDDGVLFAQRRIGRRRRELGDGADVARPDLVRRLLLLSA